MARRSKRKPDPQPSDFIAAFRPKEGPVYFVSRRMLTNELRYERQRFHKSFDATYKESFLDISEQLSRASGMVASAFTNSELSNVDLRAAGLTTHALKSIEAAVELIRSGFVVQPNVLVRAALEQLAASFAFLTDSRQSKLLDEGLFKSTAAISIATKTFPLVGRLYGMLSEEFVHASDFHSRPQPNIVATTKSVPLNVALSHVRVCLIFALVVAELFVVESSNLTWFWKAFPNGGWALNPDEKVREWMVAFASADGGPKDVGS